MIAFGIDPDIITKAVFVDKSTVKTSSSIIFSF